MKKSGKIQRRSVECSCIICNKSKDKLNIKFSKLLKKGPQRPVPYPPEIHCPLETDDPPIPAPPDGPPGPPGGPPGPSVGQGYLILSSDFLSDTDELVSESESGKGSDLPCKLESYS